MPKVTVLMTVYNNEKYLQTAIFSILNQTYKDFELIIINDGSTDDTEKIILSFKDSRIRYIQNNKNIGISKSLNKGIKLSKGKYVARMDGDDICHPTRLAKQVLFLDTHQDHGLLGSWYYIIDYNGALISVQRNSTEDAELKLSMIFSNQFLQSSILIKTDLIKELMYDEKLEVCEDYDLWLRCLDKTSVTNFPEELLTYRWHGSNTCITKQKKILESFISIFSNTFDKLELSHTSQELFMHSLLAFNLSKQYFNTDERIKKLNKWLNKIQNSKSLIKRFDFNKIYNKISEIKYFMIDKV